MEIRREKLKKVFEACGFKLKDSKKRADEYQAEKNQNVTIYFYWGQDKKAANLAIDPKVSYQKFIKLVGISLKETPHPDGIRFGAAMNKFPSEFNGMRPDDPKSRVGRMFAIEELMLPTFLNSMLLEAKSSESVNFEKLKFDTITSTEDEEFLEMALVEAEAEQANIEHIADTDSVGLPDSQINSGKRRSISPEEDEKRRRKQAENGAEGEESARLFEIERLRDLKCPDPAAYIDLVAKKDVGLGYDILTTWQETRYIEVKTSASGSDVFFISSNEVEVLTNYKNLAWIYLVDLTKKDDIRNCIRTINDPGDKFNKEIKLVPNQYVASLLKFS